MKLTDKQTQMLLAYHAWETWSVREGPLDWGPVRAAERDGRVAHGRLQTLYSLQRKGLARFDDEAGGFVLTEGGTNLARVLVEAAETDLACKLKRYRDRG